MALIDRADAAMNKADRTMDKAVRTMRTAEAIIHDPAFMGSLEATKRVLELQVELERLKAQNKAAK